MAPHLERVAASVQKLKTQRMPDITSRTCCCGPNRTKACKGVAFHPLAPHHRWFGVVFMVHKIWWGGAIQFCMALAFVLLAEANSVRSGCDAQSGTCSDRLQSVSHSSRARLKSGVAKSGFMDGAPGAEYIFCNANHEGFPIMVQDRFYGCGILPKVRWAA